MTGPKPSGPRPTRPGGTRRPPNKPTSPKPPPMPSGPPSPPRLYTVIEIAQAASVHKDTVYDWISRGELTSVDIGHGRAKTRIRESDWLAFGEQHLTQRTA